jgi:hypothetical protein
MMRADEIKGALAARALDVVMHLFPAGKRRGAEWLVGNIEGAPGDSLCIKIEGSKVGVWHDFADTEKGGDNLLELWKRARGLDFAGTLQEAAAWLGVTGLHERNTGKARPKPERWKPYRLSDDELSRCVAMAEALVKNDPAIAGIAKSRGWKPETIRELALDPCIGIEGDKLVMLYPTGAKKRVKPLTPGRAEHHEGAPFVWMFGKPDSLWRADQILRCTQRVHITEGETAAIALIDAGIDDGIAEIVMATPGASIWRNEWATELAGRHVTLWPDADQPGQKQARRIIESVGAVAASIEVCNLESTI